MIKIVKVEKNTTPVGGDVYELKLDRKIGVLFTHQSDDGLVKCLQLAATAVEQENAQRKKLHKWLKKKARETQAQVAKECVTHHHACDCREKLIQELCELYLREHQGIKALTAVFGKHEQCECEGCIKARVLAPPF